MSGPHQLQRRGSRRRLSGRATMLIVWVAVLAVAAALVLVLGRLGGSPGGGGSAGPSAGSESSAAVRLGWGEPNQVEEFDGPLGPQWQRYDGPGHADNGRRSPEAADVSGGVLTITGDAAGTTGGMAWVPGQQYGRWEGRVRAPVSDPSYNALLLLWPDAEDFPVGGEIDFMEMVDPTRQATKIFIHWDQDNKQVFEEVGIDGTQWHNWAVEWTPEHIVAYLDGTEWYRNTDTAIFPPRAMHLAIQLDWFPENQQGEVAQSTMHVDWVKQYPL